MDMDPATLKEMGVGKIGDRVRIGSQAKLFRTTVYRKTSKRNINRVREARYSRGDADTNTLCAALAGHSGRQCSSSYTTIHRFAARRTLHLSKRRHHHHVSYGQASVSSYRRPGLGQGQLSSRLTLDRPREPFAHAEKRKQHPIPRQTSTAKAYAWRDSSTIWHCRDRPHSIQPQCRQPRHLQQCSTYR